MQQLRPLCSWCLVVVNTQLPPAAKTAEGFEMMSEGFGHPAEVRRWAEQKLDNGQAIHDPFGAPDAFEPVGTWHGDPVCSPHLMVLVMESWREYGEPWNPAKRRASR